MEPIEASKHTPPNPHTRTHKQRERKKKERESKCRASDLKSWESCTLGYMRATERLFAVASQALNMSSAFAVVAGVGPGTGATVARKFGAAYPVALLARNPANYEDAVKDIKAAGGKAIGIPTDVTKAESVKDAVAAAQKEFGGDKCAAAVFNVGGKFIRKPFLELNQEEFESGWEANG
ncbi:MAG: hypothetical protein LQ338_006062 [Usnochroma carphineum]|nr:MAG: hypothetical protein LQ338_006062 [Usnochroma carphineum]